MSREAQHKTVIEAFVICLFVFFKYNQLRDPGFIVGFTHPFFDIFGNLVYIFIHYADIYLYICKMLVFLSC